MASDPDNPLAPPAEILDAAKESVLRQVLGVIMLGSVAAFLFSSVFIGPFAWILRDGLGPGFSGQSRR